jgi:hypothetical protein
LYLIPNSLGFRPVEPINMVNDSMVHTKAMVMNTRTFVQRGLMWVWVLANQHIVYFAQSVGLNLDVCLPIKVDGYR